MDNSLKLIFREQAQEIFSSFTRLLEIRTVFFTSDGKEVKVGDNRNICNYCRMLRDEFNCLKLCKQWDRDKQIQAQKERRMISYKCYASMNESVIPVFNNGVILGFIMIGQFRTSNEFKPPLRLQNLPQSVLNKLEKAYFETPLYSPQKVSEILTLFEVMADFIVSHRLVAIKNSDPIDTLLEYIANHPDQTITPSQAADMVFRSKSSISHLFKQATGMGLVEYQIENKLRLAENLMTQSPEKTIKEIALSLGFSDPLYFSRLYTRKRGFSATDYRKTLALPKTAAKCTPNIEY